MRFGIFLNVSVKHKIWIPWVPLYDLSPFYKIGNGLISIPFPVEVQTSYMNNVKYQYIQVFHADNYRNSFFPRTVRLWNAFQVSCHSAPSVAIFKSQCKSWLAPRTWGRVKGIFRPHQPRTIYGDLMHDQKVLYGYSLFDSTIEE